MSGYYIKSQTFLNAQRTLIKGAPTFEIATVEEMLPHLRADDDPTISSLVSDYIIAAREFIENEAAVSLVQRTVTIYLDEFPCGPIEIRYPPVQSVTSVTYLDDSGSSTTLSASLYRADLTTKPGRITPALDELWPSTATATNAVTVVAVVGYTSAALIPACAKQAHRIAVKAMYDSGGTLCDDMRMAISSMLDPIRWEGGV